MNRRNWMRNITMAIAASLVPRVLQPCLPEVEDEVRLNVEAIKNLQGVVPDYLNKMIEKYGSKEFKWYPFSHEKYFEMRSLK